MIIFLIKEEVPIAFRYSVYLQTLGFSLTKIKRRIEIDFFPSHLSRLAGEETIGKTNNFEGVKIIKSAGRLLVIPERNGEHVRILAEADTMEAAEEMCADMENIIKYASESDELNNI
jgi:phosphomannomutase